MAWIAPDRWLNQEESLQNAQLVANFMTGLGWSPQAISALCGNMRHESSINPNMYEIGYPWDADRGFGLVQWTPRSKYWNWAVAEGLEPREGDSQLRRIEYEQRVGIQWISTTSYPLSFNDFTTSTMDVDYLTEAFTWNYERPNREAGEASMPARKAFAQLVLESLGFTGGGKPAYPTIPESPITSQYGMRIHPITGEPTFHAGTDFGGLGGKPPIYATQTGEVILNQWSDSGGWMIYIKHNGDPYWSRYLHLDSQATVPVGRIVTKGEEIGTMGTTGSSTGIHLHFEISINGNFGTEQDTINPEDYLQMDFGGITPEPPKPTGVAMSRHNTNMRRRRR